MAISDPTRASPKALTTGDTSSTRSRPTKRVAAGGGGGGLSSTDWVRLHPLDGNTNAAINWSAGAGSDPQNYDAPRDAGAAVETRCTAASDNGTYTTIEITGCTHSGNANEQDQFSGGTCIWTWPLVDIFGDAINMDKPFHAKWRVEWQESNALGFAPYFPDANKTQVLFGVSTKATLGFSGGLPQAHPNIASSHIVGLRVGNSRHISQLVCLAERNHGASKRFTKTGSGTTNVAIGTLMQGIDRVPILTAETWKNDALKPTTPVYEHDKAGQMDIVTDAHSVWGADTTGYWTLGVGRTGSSVNAAATTLKFRIHVSAINIGDSWSP